MYSSNKEIVMNALFIHCIEIAKFFIDDWTRRSSSLLVKNETKGCFVWDLEIDAYCDSSGTFYSYEMVRDYFLPEMAKGLKKLIQEADHDKEVVAALVFEDEIIGMRLEKTAADGFMDTVTTKVH
jgi:hypothetical protein